MQTGCAVFSWALDLAILIEPLVMVCEELTPAVSVGYLSRLELPLTKFSYPDPKAQYEQEAKGPCVSRFPVQWLVSQRWLCVPSYPNHN